MVQMRLWSVVVTEANGVPEACSSTQETAQPQSLHRAAVGMARQHLPQALSTVRSARLLHWESGGWEVSVTCPPHSRPPRSLGSICLSVGEPRPRTADAQARGYRRAGKAAQAAPLQANAPGRKQPAAAERQRPGSDGPAAGAAAQASSRPAPQEAGRGKDAARSPQEAA